MKWLTAVCIVVRMTTALTKEGIYPNVTTRLSPSASSESVCITSERNSRESAMNVAAKSSVVYAHAFVRFRPIQWDVKLNSFISSISSMTKNPARGTPYVQEIANPTGASIHRKIRAWKTVIRPDGIGRQGLFIMSSVGERLWFDTQNCMRWISNQKIAWRRRRGVVGTAIAAKLVYHLFSGHVKCHNEDNAHYWQ